MECLARTALWEISEGLNGPGRQACERHTGKNWATKEHHEWNDELAFGTEDFLMYHFEVF